ncbi:SDR family oxidoreductase [Alphaproteobacteria bacterium]|jgi:nucleoside-diphosphate-sugar epimerase|nr:SDR family oxidoreductase [Alphaproteobacteria bacterium]
MNLDFLTNEFLIKDNQFDAPIVVTGAGGCIGSWILAILHRSNIPCVAIDLSEERTRLELLLGEEASKIKWHKCDITDFNSLKKIILSYEPSAIIHLAGLQVPFCAANPALGARVNVEGTINILEIAKEVNIKRTVYASSVAALGMPPKGPWKETLYGAYKLANEHTAYVYWADWQTPSIGLRPNIVYGLARDQGMSSKNTVAIQAAALDKSYKIPYTGKYSWLYAGEAALAFITSVSKDMVGSHVFNLNGSCETIENGLKLIRELKPNSSVTCEGQPLPFPPDLDDLPLRKHIGDYTSVSVQKGIEHTIKAFETLKSEGKCPAIPI